MAYAFTRRLLLSGAGDQILGATSIVGGTGGVFVASGSVAATTATIWRTTNAWTSSSQTQPFTVGLTRARLTRRPSGRILASVTRSTAAEIWRSDDMGVSWTQCQVLHSGATGGADVSQPFPRYTGGLLCTLTCKNSGANVLTELWISTDDGASWTKPGFSITSAVAAGLSIEAIDATTAVVGFALFSAGTLNIYKTTDSWATAASVYSAANGNIICLTRLSATSLMAGTSNTAAPGPKILGSSDTGASWTTRATLNAQLGAGEVYAILPALPDGTLIASAFDQAGGAAAVLESVDDGATWIVDTIDIISSTTMQCLVLGDDSVMYAGGSSGNWIYSSEVVSPPPPEIAPAALACVVTPFCPEDEEP